VLGESLVMGVAGAAAGVGLGVAGAAIIAAVAPESSATVPASSAAFSQAAGPATALGGGVPPTAGPVTASHVVAVPLHPSIPAGVIVLAAVLSVAGSLLAGSLGSWRSPSCGPRTHLLGWPDRPQRACGENDTIPTCDWT
jgi:putative ABC transport system permease protein